MKNRDIRDYSQDQLAEYRTEMSEYRTDMATARTNLANTQTLLSFIRTAVGVFAGGVGMAEFIQNNVIVITGYCLICVAPFIAAAGIIYYVRMRMKINLPAGEATADAGRDDHKK